MDDVDVCVCVVRRMFFFFLLLLFVCFAPTPGCPGCCRGTCDPFLPALLTATGRSSFHAIYQKETLRINKHKQRRADPGNNGGEREGVGEGEEGANKKTQEHTHTHTQTKTEGTTHMWLFKQNKK